MKKLLVLVPICAVLFTVLFTGCANTSNVFPPITTAPVLMGSVSLDSVTLASDGSATKIAPLGSGGLNFTDRDSTIISFFYKGSTENTASYKFQVYDSTGSLGITPIFTFTGTVTPEEQYLSVRLPSHGKYAYYYYSLNCSGTAPQYFSIRKLDLYKK